MAEVIGIVASGIAIGQATTAITSSLLKLKSLWNEFRDVPEDLLHLVHELEIVYLVLAESDPQGTSETCTPSSRSLELAWQLTNDGAKELKSLVDDLQAELKPNQLWKRKFVAAKIVLKRDQIKRLKSRLKTCIRLLTLANQSKISSMLERQPGLLAMELTAMTRNLDHATQEDETDQDNTTQITKARTTPQQSEIIQNQSAFQLRFRLLYRQWYFYCHQSRAGWDLVFRVFNIISYKDPLISACFESDNDELLREYFRAGKASPLMLVDQGWIGTRGHMDTLLAFAVQRGSFKTTQLLLDEGAKIFEDSIETYSHAIFNFLSSTVGFMRIGLANNQLIDEQRLLSLGEILLQDPQAIDQNIDGQDDESWTDLACFQGTVSSFRLLLSLYPNYYNLPFRSRAYVTMEISDGFVNSPDVVRAALGTVDSSEFDLEILPEEYYVSNPDSTLLQCVATRLGHSVFEPTYRPSRGERYGALYRSTVDSLSIPVTDMCNDENYPLCGWEAFVGQLIRAGADPNYETARGTALIRVVAAAFAFPSNGNPYSPYYTSPTFECALRKPGNGWLALLAWLRVLKDSGVDLEAYGHNETLIFSREDAEWPGRKILLYGFDHDVRAYLSLIAFEFGPNPEDWKFWFSDPTDQLVGEFWDMVEHPERRIPGAWDEFSW